MTREPTIFNHIFDFWTQMFSKIWNHRFDVTGTAFLYIIQKSYAGNLSNCSHWCTLFWFTDQNATHLKASSEKFSRIPRLYSRVFSPDGDCIILQVASREYCFRYNHFSDFNMVWSFSKMQPNQVDFLMTPNDPWDDLNPSPDLLSRVNKYFLVSVVNKWFSGFSIQ